MSNQIKAHKSIDTIQPAHMRYTTRLNITTQATKEQEEAYRKTKAKNQAKSQEQLKPLSTAFLHPILEDNEIKCPHNGVVKLKSICYNIGLVS